MQLADDRSDADRIYPDEAAWVDARTCWVHSRQETQLLEWICATLRLPILLLRDRRYAIYDRHFFGERAGQVVLAALGTLHTLVGAPPPPRRRIDAPEWLLEQDEADQRRCSILLERMPKTGESVLEALLEYMPGGRLARGAGLPETYAVGIVCALAHHTPRALSEHAPLVRRMVSLLDLEESGSHCATSAGAALRCIGVAGLCQSRHAINRLLVEGSRPHPPVYVLTALIRFVGSNRNSLTRVRCSYTHRWDSPSLLLPPGISPQDGREGDPELGVEGPEGQWQWLTNRVWNEDDGYAAAPVIVAFCAILAIGWSEPQTLLQLLAAGIADKKAAAPVVSAPAPVPTVVHSSNADGYERDPVSGKEVYREDGEGKHGVRHGGGGYNAGGSTSATVLDGRFGYKVEPRLLQQLWAAIHHERTLFGRPCRNVRTFFDAADRQSTGALTRRELADAMVRLDMGLSPVQLDRMLSTIDAEDGAKDGLIQYNEFAGWLHGRLGEQQLKQQTRPGEFFEADNDVRGSNSNVPGVPARPLEVPFIVPSSLQMLLTLLDLTQTDSPGSLVCVGAARVLSLLLSMATGTAPTLIGRRGSDRFWDVTEVNSPLWTLLEVLCKAAELQDAADFTNLAIKSADGDSAAHSGSEAHRWAVQVLWLWLRDVDVAARSAAQRTDLQRSPLEYACGLASVEGVLDYLVRRAQGRSVAVAAALAVATYTERKTLLQYPAGNSSATTAAAIRREVDQREVWRMEERERAGLGGTGSGVRAATGMLIGLGRKCAACYKSCGGLLPWVEYAGQHDGRGRRPPAQVLEDCKDSLRRADFIWVAANQSVQMYVTDGEAEVKMVLHWRRRAIAWIDAARR